MKFQRKKVATALACALGVSGTVLLADTAQAQIKVEVTGSNIPRVEAEGALPVTVITREEIQKSGVTTTDQLMRQVSAAVQGNSNTGVASAVGTNSAGVSSASLRGLGSQRTLVLINGKRISAGGTITDSTTVDINSIPLAAIERVDVLKDGASAIYGSDAIAGVINFILRSDYTGAEATAYGGFTEDGGGETQKYSASAGWGNLGTDRYNVMVVGSYQKDNSVFGSQRDFAKSSIYGSINDTTSGNTFPANISARDGSFGTRNPMAPNNCSPSLLDPNFPSTRCRFDPAPFLMLLPDIEQYQLYGSGRFQVTPNVQLYGEAMYSHQRQHYTLQPSPVSQQFSIPDQSPVANLDPRNPGTASIVLRPSSPYYPTSYVQGITGGATPDLDVFWRAFAIGSRDFTDTRETPRAVIGVKGTALSWDFDFNYLYTQTKLSEVSNNGIGLYTRLLPLANSGVVNFFGPNTPEVQAQLDQTKFIGEAYSTKSTMDGFAGKLSREIWQLPAGPMAVALGGEWRKEKFDTNPADALLIGDTTHYGGDLQPQHASRDVKALFAELNIPIIKTLEADVAVRYDDYEGTGSKTTPKYSLRWQPVRQVLVRGAYGKGFRAPSLTELYQPVTLGVSANGLSDPLRCNKTDANGVVNNSANDCLTQFPITIGGNPNLKPEESDNYTLGIVLEPVKNFSASVDYFNVKLKNTIIFGVEPASILNDLATFGSLVERGPADPSTPGLPGRITRISQQNLNFGETKVEGYDLDLRYRWTAGSAGDFRLALSGTYFDKYEVQTIEGQFVGLLGKVSPITNGNGGVIPRWHHIITLDWTRGPWNANVSQNFQLGYEDIPGTLEDNTAPDFQPRRVGNYETWDVQGSYMGFKKLKLTLGVKNLFNRDPPYTNAGGQNFFQSGYDPGYADPRGRFYYGSLTYTFK